MPDRLAADWIVVGLLTLVAFLLRVSQLHQTLVGDEVSTYQDIVGHSLRNVLSTVHTGAENSPPLFFLLAWVAAKLGDATVWIRVPSLLAGTATVPVVHAIGRETIGRVGGLIAAAVVALTPFAVYYGIEARPYATMTFFVALSTWALLRAVRTGGVRWWVLYTLSATAAAYCHYTGVFVLGAQAVWALWTCRERLRTPLIANAAVLVLYSPWLPHLRGKALAVIGALYPLGFHRVLTDLVRPFPGHPAAPLHAIPTVAGLIAVGAGAVGGLIALGLRRRRRSPGSRWLPSRFGLLVALAVATPIGLLLYSLTVTDLWLPRGLSASLPAIALVFGGLLAVLPRPLTVLAATALILTLAAGTLRSFDAVYARGPFRTLAAYLDRVARPGDPVTIVSFVGAPALGVEFRRRHLVLGSLARMWTLTSTGANAYVVLDDVIASRYKLGTPRHPGFGLVARRHYAGSFPTELLTYRRLPSAR
ncbi:MAG: glycosyltransferase family 39 protein [Actinomycetota bacterium]|nr:glycosyltransferase family 39 protein [Actinomycetota bacterium]